MLVLKISAVANPRKGHRPFILEVAKGYEDESNFIPVADYRDEYLTLPNGKKLYPGGTYGCWENGSTILWAAGPWDLPVSEGNITAEEAVMLFS